MSINPCVSLKLILNASHSDLDAKSQSCKITLQECYLLTISIQRVDNARTMSSGILHLRQTMTICVTVCAKYCGMKGKRHIRSYISHGTGSHQSNGPRGEFSSAHPPHTYRNTHPKLFLHKVNKSWIWQGHKRLRFAPCSVPS